MIKSSQKMPRDFPETSLLKFVGLRLTLFSTNLINIKAEVLSARVWTTNLEESMAERATTMDSSASRVGQLMCSSGSA